MILAAIGTWGWILLIIAIVIALVIIAVVGRFIKLWIQAFFSKADVFALASLTESYGMVYAESMAAGLPAIGNRVGGVPEIIMHDKTGFLCEPKNRTEWRTHLESVLSSPNLRSRLRSGSIEIRNCLMGWSSTAERLIGLLDELLVTFSSSNNEPANHKDTS